MFYRYILPGISAIKDISYIITLTLLHARMQPAPSPLQNSPTSPAYYVPSPLILLQPLQPILLSLSKCSEYSDVMTVMRGDDALSVIAARDRSNVDVQVEMSHSHVQGVCAKQTRGTGHAGK